jgi:hypothetical protein
MVAQMVYGPGQETIREAWQQRLHQAGIQVEDRQQVSKWLGQRSTQGCTRLFIEFCWLYQIT